jgi:hypothetical protein
MIIFHSGHGSNAPWCYEFYYHPTVWTIGLQIVFRWDDIYAISFLCLTFQVTKNEDYRQ